MMISTRDAQHLKPRGQYIEHGKARAQQLAAAAAQMDPTKPLRIVVPFAAIGKPRQTQSDRWRQRPCVMAYRAWCDALRASVGIVPPADQVRSLWIRCVFKPPDSWKLSKRAAAMGKLKRTKPDADNCAKAVMDALWPDNDAAIADVRCVKLWGPEDQMVIEIEIEARRR